MQPDEGTDGTPRPLRVGAFTGGAAVPSARLRVRQYIAPLAARGIAIEERFPRLGAYPPRRLVLRPAWLAGTLLERLPQVAKGRGDDIALMQREMISTLVSFERLTRRPRVVDIDDAVHLHRAGRTARHLGALADLVIVGNAFLAEIWRGWASRVEILPTAVDTASYPMLPLPERPVVGWIGLASNLPYLQEIAPALAAVVARFPGTAIAVCSDAPPALPGLPVAFVPWSPAAEPGFLASLSVGVMPLRDGPWERGKCSYKMLQYMAAGRPCVVSPVGMNRELLAEGEIGCGARTIAEWTEALGSLIADPSAAQQMGRAGRHLAETGYSLTTLAPRLDALLRSVA